MTKQKESEKTEKQELNIEEMNLFQKLFMFQNEDIIIPKSKKAYGYYYADLDSIQEIIKPFCQKYGIGYYHDLTENDESQQIVSTTVFNFNDVGDCITSRTTIDDTVKLSGMNKFMVVGSAITYYRRYHLVTMLGLTTDQDNDAGGGTKDTNEKATTTTSKKPAGRSVQSAKTESEVDYVAIFENLVAKGKTITQLNKMYDKYKKNMSDEAIKKITKIIKESNENK